MVVMLLLFQGLVLLVDSVYSKGVVEGVVGHPVSVPCDLTPPAQGDSPHLVLWYKPIDGNPIYSVDLRNGIHAAKHWADKKVFMNRENFYIKEEQGSILAFLNISDTKPSDAGVYRCRVDFYKAATRNLKISVNLTAEVESLNIYNEKGKLFTGRTVSSMINGSLLLTCKSLGGTPAPVLTWRIGDQQIAAQNLAGNGDTVSTSLELKGLQPRDSGKVVTCFAKNNDIHPAPNATVKIEIVLAPVRVEISRTVSTFVAGTSYNLSCQVLGSNPTPTTHLWVAGQRLDNILERESTDGKIFTIVSSFHPTAEHDGAFVSCRAQNKYLPKEALEDQWKISVVYAPISSIKVEDATNSDQTSIDVEVGRRVVISCEAKANPKPFEYHWRHRHPEDTVSPVPSSSATLVLENIDQKVAGVYTCLAENLHGLGESNQVRVNVLYPPSCKSNRLTEISIAVHESIDLSCEMDANPGNLTFQWSLDTGGPEEVVSWADVPSSQFTQHEGKSVLTLTPRTPGDFGRVTCEARNTVGTGAACTYLINKKISVPGLKTCLVSADWSSITVVCEPETPVLDSDVEFEAELTDTGLGLQQRIPARSPTFRFAPVRQNAVYTLNVAVLQRVPSLRNKVEKIVKFSQVISIKESLEPVILATERSLFYEDQMMQKLLPLVGVSGILIFAFIIIMISISIVRRSRDIFKKKSVHTHVKFNQGLDQDLTPDVLQHLRPVLQHNQTRDQQQFHRNHSMDQLNQITFEGFGSDALKAALLPKYNTLPAGRVSVVSVISNSSEGSTVKRVTFAKGTVSSCSSENSSNDSVRTIRDRSEYMNIQPQEEQTYQYEESSLI